MSMLDRIRQKQGNTQINPEQIQAHSEHKAKARKSKGDSPTTITFSCGCVKQVAHIIAKACGACREKERQEKNKAAKQKTENKQSGLPHGESWKKKASQRLSRLPHGSEFSNLIYHKSTKSWTGNLIIPAEWLKEKFPDENSDDPLVFTASAEAVFKLMNALDSHWRVWLEEKRGQKLGEEENYSDQELI